MIIEYHRPQSLAEAMRLLSRPEVVTVPLGGGSHLNQPSKDQIAVVDLQALQLNTARVHGTNLELGATLTLEQLLAIPEIPPSIAAVIKYEATKNLRQVATVAGTLMAADGRSPLTTLFLALDAQLTILPGPDILGLGEVLPVRIARMPGRLITQVSIPIQAKSAYEYVARTPADLPIVCIAVVKWPSGRTRVAVGGYGVAPKLAIDGPDTAGISLAVKNSYDSADDEWASAEYRREVGATLSGRCLETLSG